MDDFGIPYKDTLFYTHIRSPHPSEIITLHEVADLVNLHRIDISFIQIRSIVLYILPFCVIQHASPFFISHISPSIIPSYSSTQCVNNYFILHILSAKDKQKRTYKVDPHTQTLLDRLSINASLDGIIIL